MKLVKKNLFIRISTVAGGAGSVGTQRDVRGFAVRFYTREGNRDLVGANIPAFFIQDAIKFPDLIYAVKNGTRSRLSTIGNCARYILGLYFPMYK